MAEAAGTVDVEVTPLEGVDLEGAPPCEMVSGWRRFGVAGGWVRRSCRRRAAFRVRVVCPVHGTTRRFLCGRHLRFLRWGLATCWSCDNRNPVSFGGHS